MAGDGADLERAPKRRRRRDEASPSRRHREAKAARDFYGSALDAAERIEPEAASDVLEAASEVQGLDGEIAVLRLKLREVLADHPEDLPLMLRGIELLVKAVSARYRLSKRAEDDLAESIAGVVRGVGGLLMPEAFADE